MYWLEIDYVFLSYLFITKNVVLHVLFKKIKSIFIDTCIYVVIKRKKKYRKYRFLNS